MFERYAAIQRVAKNKFVKNTLSFVHFTSHKPDNEGTAKHELEGESRSRPGLCDQIPQDGRLRDTSFSFVFSFQCFFRSKLARMVVCLPFLTIEREASGRPVGR